MARALLQLDGVEKAFGGVQALKQTDLEVDEGEVVGLIGENGAGKSTLVKLISGVHQPDRGTIYWLGKRLRVMSPHHATQAGIATIHQELAFFGTLSVAENLLMAESWPRTFWGGTDWRALFHEARNRLSHFDLKIDPEKRFDSLSSAEKQEVAIARALSQDARLLILDEPTASLSEQEVSRLFDHLKRLRNARVAIIYVSHRLDELKQLSDRVVVLRDGECVASYRTQETDVNRMVRDMVGRPLEQVYPRGRTTAPGRPVLELEAATRRPLFHDVSFTLRTGEIVGLAGLVGAGRSELARAIFGLYPITSGQMLLFGKGWAPRGADEAVRAGLVYIPEERKRQGLVMDHSVRDAISIGISDRLTRWGIIPPKRELERVQAAMGRYGIRARSPDDPIGTLSGGNQQKTLIARWLDRAPQVIILDEPTRGVDIGAKAEIHRLIDELAQQGKAILLISSDLPEILGMSDRLLVMYDGTVVSELTGERMTQENVLLAASGMSLNTSSPIHQ